MLCVRAVGCRDTVRIDLEVSRFDVQDEKLSAMLRLHLLADVPFVDRLGASLDLLRRLTHMPRHDPHYMGLSRDFHTSPVFPSAAALRRSNARRPTHDTRVSTRDSARSLAFPAHLCGERMSRGNFAFSSSLSTFTNSSSAQHHERRPRKESHHETTTRLLCRRDLGRR